MVEVVSDDEFAAYMEYLRCLAATVFAAGPSVGSVSRWSGVDLHADTVRAVNR